MENYNDQNEFKYTYSAKEQAELKRIREKYTNKEENKMERLRRLDTRVTQKAQAVSLIFGVVGAMVLGFGMSLIMSDLALILGFKGAMAIIFGVISGIIGGILVGLAYPLYNIVLKKERAKAAPEIIRLTDELMK